MATIQDVAKHAHVGVGTVSRVLSGKGYVKDETRKKIEASIEALDYTPNEMARNLFYRKSGIVAVIVPEISHPFFSQFVNAAEVALAKQGYQTMVCNAFYENKYELRYLDMLKAQRVDGIIFGAHVSLDISQYEKIRRPIVAFDRNLGPAIPRVSSDHGIGGRLAAEALIRSGCKNVAQFGRITSEDKIATPSVERHRMFAEVMEAHGIPCLSYDINWTFSDIGYYQKEAYIFLREHPEIDGLFGADQPIMSVMQAALSNGIRIPEQLKLVGYDGTIATELTHPRLTVVVQPIVELAEESVRLLVDLIDGKAVSDKIVELPVTLREGGTTTGK